MPEPVTIPVDYLSGDYSSENSVNSARFEGRCLQHQSEAWDLMAWSFTSQFKEPNRSTKSILQLQQEASVVVALGGGFQAYFKQKRDGSIQPWTMELMAAVGEFCRERQELCHKAKPIPQVALLYAGKSFYRLSSKAFGSWANETLKPMAGILQNLLDSQFSVEICMEHHLEGRMSDYPVIVVPEWPYLDPEFRDSLAEYAKNGGNLVIVGPDAARLFEAELDVTLDGDTEGYSAFWLEHQGWMAAFAGHRRNARLGARATAFGYLYTENDFESRDADQPAAVVSGYGSGTVSAILFEMGNAYLRGATSIARDFLAALVNHVFTNPKVTVTGSHRVDVSLMQKDLPEGPAALVNLVNTAGPHGDPTVYVYDEVPAVGPLTVTVAAETEPSSVTLEPGGKTLEYAFENGVVTATVPSLDIHRILALR